MEKFAKVVSERNTPVTPATWGGTLHWLTKPSITGAENMSTVIIDIPPTLGHPRHCHPETEEVLFVLEGTGTHTYFLDDGTERKFELQPGDLMFMAKGQYHSTFNTSNAPLKLLGIYTKRDPDNENVGSQKK